MTSETPWKWWLAGGLAILAGGLVIAEFAVPSAPDRAGAAGSVLTLDAPLKRAFTDSREFVPKKAPEPGDWLAQHNEPGQTFEEFRRSGSNKPDATRRVLYILPIGEFQEGTAPELTSLREYTAAYYAPLPVRMLPAVKDSEVKVAERINEMTDNKQWKSTDLLRWMTGRLPADAYAMIAVTMTDLYPQESWNFVFGQASLKHRVGVFSFARYHPAFYKEKKDAGTATLLLQRAAKVLTHETGHMFGIPHCIYYECNMNGANHLGETDGAPMHLCPVCLRKMHHAVGFDPAFRYEKLLEFYEKHKLEDEAKWVRKRLEKINAP